MCMRLGVSNHIPFKLSDGRHKGEQQLASAGTGVDGFLPSKRFIVICVHEVGDMGDAPLSGNCYGVDANVG